MNIDLERLDAAELALICEMCHIDDIVRFTAKDMLEAQVGSKNSKQLQAAALKAIDQINATDAALYDEEQR